MKFVRSLVRFAAFVSLLTLPICVCAKDRITILYDAFADSKEVVKDWGFSALVECQGKRILFDTGNNADLFERNVRTLKVDLTQLDFVVISHRHSDHITGLKYLLKVNPKVPIYVPVDGAGPFGSVLPSTFLRAEPSLPENMRYFDGHYPKNLPAGKLFDQGNFIPLDKITEISPGIYAVPTISKNAGTLELRELTLVIKGPRGLMLVDGCSHAGIDEILQAAAALDSRFHIVFGGLHLVTTPVEDIDRLAANLKNRWKLDKIAPGHCTGEAAFLRLKKVFGNDYLYAGAGTRIEVP